MKNTNLFPFFCVLLPKITKQMTLHIFNPEHDIALAANLSNFTAPHAGRQLRYDLCFLPALWAKEGDGVLVDNPERAQNSYKHFLHSVSRQFGKSFHLVKCPRWEQAVTPAETTAIQPWGWDLALRSQLKRIGADASLLPTDDAIAAIRQLSHRRTSAELLPQLRFEGTVGESFECTTADETVPLLQRYDRLVLKAPWSSSGRGLRFIRRDAPVAQTAGWLRNLLTAQGSVMAEPFYDKVKDFGMEFECSSEGKVNYLGLSLFHTANGAYTGNLLATEKVKQDILSHYISIDLLHSVIEKICQLSAVIFKGRYVGPFGVDMMVVRGTDGCLLHPCVEINLRRTMGHVALSLTPDDDDIQRVMQIDYSDNRYHLRIIKP